MDLVDFAAPAAKAGVMLESGVEMAGGPPESDQLPRLAGRGLGRAAPAAGDTALVRAAQSGSEEAIEALFRRHWRRAHRAAYLIVRDQGAAEDIAQEAFLAALRALDRFDRRRPFRPWLHRIVVNRAIDHARARSLRVEVDSAAIADLEAPEVSAELGDDVLAALAELDVEQRAVVVLRYLLDYRPGEIARMLDLPRGTVNSRLRRGLDRLADALGGTGR